MKRLFVALALLTVNVALAADSASTNSSTGEKKKGFGAFLDGFLKRTTTAVATNTNAVSQIQLGNLSTNQIAAGIKEALATGLQKAVANLGQTNGFLTNATVRIPLPSQLKVVSDGLHRLNQGYLVDDFVATMNHAAEEAIPIASSVFTESLKKMSVEDAVALLNSKSPTAATEYFQKTCTAELTEKLMPLIKQKTEQVGVTSAYKTLMSKASFGTKLFSTSSLNLDRYVTGKTLEGLFTMVGEEERKIRENPKARATELLQQVFGILKPATDSPNVSPKSNQ